MTRTALGLALAALLASAAAAQQFDRRARDEPEVVIEAGGRVGTADVIRFTPDGNFLLAGGDDRVVRVWPHSAGGLDANPRNARVLRWRGWRDQHGGVKCLSPSPDGTRVAVGGYGLKVNSVAILDRDTGATAAITWPRAAEGGYRDAVDAVGFHPDGRRVGFGTADGTLWLWDPVKLDRPDGDRVWNAPVCVGRFPNPEPDRLNHPRNIHFPDRNTMVAVSHRGQVAAVDLRGRFTDDPNSPPPAVKVLFGVFDGRREDYRVYRAAWTGDGKWLAAATTGPLVLLRSADGARTVPLRLPADHALRALAVHPKTGKVAVGVISTHPPVGDGPRFYAERDDVLWVYDDPTAGRVPAPRKVPFPGRIEALGFHPTLDRLAVAGGDADEVTLLDLATPDRPVSVVRGAGRRVYAVNLSEGGDAVAVQTGRNPASTDPNDRGSGPWVRFDLARFAPTADARQKWLGPVTSAGGWEVVPDRESRFVWHAERAGAGGARVRVRLRLDPDLDQAPTCFTFVPTAAGLPARLLVGHYYGCSLFELDPARAEKGAAGELVLPRSKLFIGHGAEVNAVAADKTGTWFVTAGADQTVAGWSLADWGHEAALGAGFAAADGRLVVGPVDVGSPAWEAGLSTGDRVELLAVGGKAVYDRRPGRTVGTLEKAVAALERPRSGVELFFGWTTARGDRRATPTHLKQRPLWKWFPAFDDRGRLTDSVVWMWHGSYYFTASAHADRMVGWHVNAPEVAGTATFHPLERYKHLFLRPDVIEKLLATRSVAEALKLGAGDNPLKRSFREVEAAPVDLALKSAVVRADGVKLTVSVNPAGNDPDLLPERVELWVNDHRFRAWPGKGQKSFHAEVTVPAEAFRAGENRVTVLALNPARGRAEAGGIVTNPAKAADPTLWGVAVGINDYAAHRKAVAGVRSFGDLAAARADATALSRQLLAFRGPDRFFRAGGLSTLLDGDAGRGNIVATLADLKAAAVKPDDLLVVFLAGHGDLVGGDGKPVAPRAVAGRGLPADSGSFVFCCPDYAPSRAAVTSVAAAELFDALAAINCRKLVLIDACHAGGAVESNVLRRFIPEGQGPVVIASCDQGQESYEDEKLGHGAFTHAVLEALGPKFRTADANSDGALSPAELYDYLAARVPAVAREIRPGAAQNPICFPRPDALPTFAFIKK